jgi:hypothetical protein
MQILVGCDPEVFVRKGGEFVSAFGLIKGDKQNPQKVNRGAVQVDGMALEFNIDPAHSEDEFCLNVQDVFATMCSMVPGYEVIATPVAHFSYEYMKTQPKEALELGCDPDYNAWSNMVNIKPNGDRPMRTASGHIHIGWTGDENVDDANHRHRCNLVAQQLDFYLGLGSLAYDSDIERREMYGKAGCVRYKPYGVEYRTLSNAWLKSEKLMRWAYRNTIAGVQRAISGDILADRYGDIQAIINESRVEEGLAICKTEGIEVCYG